MQLMNGLGSRRYLLGLLVLLTASSAAWAGVPASPPPSWIYDGANLLAPEELSELATLKAQLEQQTGTRLVVLTLASADGASPKSIAVDTLNAWNAGRQSVLLLVLLSPRALYIQPGTDLASALDSATSSSICSDVVAPKLRGGDRAGAIQAGLHAIAARITSAGTLQRPSSASSPSRSSEDAETGLERFVEAVATHVGMLVLGMLGLGILGVWRLSARKCKECGTRMKKTSQVTEPATYSSAGEGLHTFTCGSCGYSFTETYFISQLSRSSSSSDSWSSDSDSSWSSSSSDSSSSSSSSSDGSGGGGSGW